jgi:transposase
VTPANRIWRWCGVTARGFGAANARPNLIAEVLRKQAPVAKRVVFETGPLSVWFYHALSAVGLPAICIDARHAKAALDMAPNKTDGNDADGLAHLAEVGFYREGRVKGYDSMLIRTLVAARTRLVRITTELSNQIRGLMKTFGLVIPRTPSNPLWTITDIAAAAEIAHKACAKLAVDSTCALPVHARPPTLGADIVMHAATKDDDFRGRIKTVPAGGWGCSHAALPLGVQAFASIRLLRSV